MRVVRPMSAALLARDINLILGRCKEHGDCLLWGGAVNNTGTPRANWTVDGEKVNVNVRRFVYCKRHGKRDLPSFKLVTVTCNNPLCLQHLGVTTRSEMSLELGARADVRAKRVVGITRGRRAQAKLNVQLVVQIRETDCPGHPGHKSARAWARELGMSTDAITRVRKNETWRDLSTHASPFAGLQRAA